LYINNKEPNKMNRFSKKPINVPVAITPENFPELAPTLCLAAPEWKYKEVIIKSNAKFYPNGDIFEGDYNEETGRPLYGKITFVNGNVYKGPIHYSWPKDCDDDDESGDDDDWSSENYEEFVEYDNRGVLFYPDGKRFIGVFCFGQEW